MKPKPSQKMYSLGDKHEGRPGLTPPNTYPSSHVPTEALVLLAEQGK